MTFEEKFPSLKDKSGVSMCKVEYIQKYTIDKQKVKEALFRIADGSSIAYYMVQRELKELGLGEE